MAERRVFRIMAMEQGWCCAHGCLSIEDVKAHAKGQKNIPFTWFRRFGMEPGSGQNVLLKWRKGEYKCEHLSNCMLAQFGLTDDDIPYIGESKRRFQGMRGQTYKVYKTEGAPQRKGEPIRGVVMRHSDYDWLWISIALPEADPEIKLGDPLWLDNLLWGTVVDIEGPIVTLLLPGHHHKLRLNKILMNPPKPPG